MPESWQGRKHLKEQISNPGQALLSVRSSQSKRDLRLRHTQGRDYLMPEEGRSLPVEWDWGELPGEGSSGAGP